jgi:hypothetical protein
MVCSFCERLDDAVLRSTIATFRSRVEFGVRAEAVALTAIKYIKVRFVTEESALGCLRLLLTSLCDRIYSVGRHSRACTSVRAHQSASNVAPAIVAHNTSPLLLLLLALLQGFRARML